MRKMGREAGAKERMFWRQMAALGMILLLSVLFRAGMIRALAADETVRVGDYEYTISQGVAVISKYKGSATSVTVPTSMTYENKYYRIRTVGASAYEGCQSLQRVIIPEQITSLGKCAFKDCTRLSSITINGNLGDCDEGSINGSRSSYWDQYPNFSTFCNAGTNAESLTVTFGDSVKVIPAYLFATGALKSDGGYPHVTGIAMGKGIETIGKYAFYNCHDLQSISWGGNEKYINSYAFANCESLTIAEWGADLRTIGSYAFQNDTGLTNLNFPGKLTEIGEYSFEACTSVTGITFPASVVSLAKCAFKSCTGISALTINGNLGDCDEGSINGSRSSYWDQYPNFSTFYSAGTNAASLTVTFGDQVTRIPAYLFATAAGRSDTVYAHVTKVIFGRNVSQIGACAFYNCYDLTQITFRGGVPTVGENAFGGCEKITADLENPSAWKGADLQDFGGGKITWQNSSSTTPSTPASSSSTTPATPASSSSTTPSTPASTPSTTPAAAQPASSKAEPPAVGTVLSTKSASYIVTKAGKEVSYRKPVGKRKTVTIPAAVKLSGVTYKVTGISASAFARNTTITKITVGKNVKKIGRNAFFRARKLKSLIIRTKKLTAGRIGKFAFTQAGVSNYKKLVVKVPSSKKKTYTKLFRAKGLSKKASVRKL